MWLKCYGPLYVNTEAITNLGVVEADPPGGPGSGLYLLATFAGSGAGFLDTPPFIDEAAALKAIKKLVVGIKPTDIV